MLKKYTYHIFIIIAYIASAMFMALGVRTEIYHIIQHPAFLTDYEFFKDFVDMPGGVGQYCSLFVEQYLYTPFWGVVMLMAEVLLSAFLLNVLIKKIFNKTISAKSLLWILPLFVTILCTANVYFAFQIITQLIITLAIAVAIHSFSTENKMFAPIAIVAAVAVYHLCGPIYLYCFCISEIIIYFITNSNQKLINSVCVAAVAIFYPAILYRFLWALPPKFIFYYPVSDRVILELFQPTMFAYYAIIPLSIVIQHFINKVNFTRNVKKGKKEKVTKDYAPMFYGACCGLMLICLIWAYNTGDNKRERFSARIAYEGERSNWQYVIENTAKSKVYDRNTNFYFDMALSQTGLMSNHLFDYPHLLGNAGMLLEEPIAGAVCYPSSTLYFNLGQLSNSLRYAYESIIYFKNSPYVMRRIIDCLIISGHFTEAEMFIKQLDRNMLAHNFVKDRREFIANGKSQHISAEFVKQKRELAVRWDYVLSPPFRNFESLMLSNKSNMAATDYLLCYLLLNNDLDNFVNALLESNYNLKNLPKHYQEGIAMYWSTTQNPNPKTREIVLNEDIKRRFADFTQIVNQQGSNAYPIIKQNFANTYWIYYTFDNPMSKGFSLKNSQQ